jgi:two-component system, sensor histidine kinase and response regulator
LIGAAIAMALAVFARRERVGRARAERELVDLAGELAALRRSGALRDSEDRFRATFENAAVGMAVSSPGGQIAAILQDISARKSLEEDLQRTRDLLELGVRSSDLSIFEFDLRHDPLASSRPTLVNFWELLGYNPAEMPRSFAEASAMVLPPEDHDRVYREMQAYLSGATPRLELEHRVRHKDGSLHWRLARGVAVRDPQGNAIRLIGSHVDITARKQIEERLRDSERRWRSLTETLPQLVWTAAADGTIEYLSAQATGYTGKSELELLGDGWANAIHPDDLGYTGKSWFEAVETQQPHEVQHRIRRWDGQYRWFTTRAEPARDANGQVFKWIGSSTDITMLKDLEANARRTKELLELGVRGSKVSIFEFDMPDGKLETARQTMINLWESLGYEPAGVPGDFSTGFELAVHPDDLERVRADTEAYLSGRLEKFEVEFRARHKDGSTIWHLARGVAFRDSAGTPLRFIGSFVDITDKKQIEQQLRASEQRWRSHAESLPQFVFTTTPDGSADYFSATTSAYTGLSQSDLIGWAWTTAIHPDDLPRTTQTWLDNRANHTPHQVEHRIRRADGVYRWFTTRAAAVWDGDGNIVAWFGTCTDIENLKQLEVDLRHAKELLELGVRGSKVGIFEFDMPDGKLETARQTMINVWETLGYDGATAPTEFLPGSILATHPDDLARVHAAIERYLSRAIQDFEVEFRVRHRDGSVAWRLARGIAFWDSAGAPTRFLGSFFDITDKKQVEERLRESEQRWRNIAETLPQLVWTATTEGGGDYFSAQTEQYTGRPEAELIGPGWLTVIHPDDRERTMKVWSAALQSETLYEVDFRIRRADGVYRWFTTRAAPLRDGSGRVFKWFGTCTDIEDGKQVEERLRESEHRWRNLAETLPQFVFTTGADGVVDYFSARTTEYTGKPLSELLGTKWGSVIHPDDLERMTTSWLEAVERQQSYQIEHRIRRWDGEYRWFTTRAEAVRDSDGWIFKWFGTSTDVTNFKELEAELRHAKERLEVAIRSSNLSIWEYDMPDAAIEHATETLTNVWESLGYEVGVDAPAALSALIHPDDLARVTEENRRYLSDETKTFETEHRVRHKDGTYRWVLGRGVALRDPRGRALRFVGTSVDITAIKQIENDLLRAREAAETANRAKDEFLANVSHEIRTPMNAILGMTELALDSAPTDHQRQLLTTVRSAAKNLLGIINDLLDFSKIAAGKIALDEADFWLRAEVHDTVRALAARAHRKGLELICRVRDDVPDALFGDAGRLRQVLMNLVGNALKFTARGEVVVEVSMAPGTTPTDADQVASLVFTIRDTGIGIARNKQAAIFRAFEQEDSSTTRRYGGTGLGLTISAQLAALMDGTITVESEPGRGSTFAFTARFTRSSSSEPQPSAPSPDVLEGLRVLVIDDNETNRRILAEWLTSWRMRPAAVGDARSAFEALAQGEETGKPYSLILLDGRMPDVDGISLAVEILQQHGDSKRLILLSSDDSPVLATRSREVGIRAYLLKPAQQSDLLDAIWAVMQPETASTVAAPPRTARPGASESNGRTPGLRILVAEDNELNAALLRTLLGKRGHITLFAEDGRAALKRATEAPFDLVLLDLHMPWMDGFEVVRAIRERERTTGKHLPIIALTARSSNRDRDRCLAAGMDEFLSKPIEAEALWAAVDRMVKAFPPAPPRRPRLLDARAILRACAGAGDVLEGLCDVFRRSLPDQLTQIRSLLGVRDFARLADAAHKLCGTLGAFSAIAGAVALVLEDVANSEDLEGCAELVDQLDSMCAELLEDTRDLTIDALAL